jgi:hypothetical protein
MSTVQNPSESNHTMTYTTPVVIEGDPGEHIDSAITRAIEAANITGRMHSLTFNGVDLPIAPGAELADRREAWGAAMDERCREWEASPEGQASVMRQAAARNQRKAREAAGGVHVESDMAESKAPRCSTAEELKAYIDSLVNGTHSYGTCVYAMSLAAEAAFNFVASQLEVTGAQAGCASLDVLKRLKGIDGPFMIVRGADFLYPQRNPFNQLTEAMDEWRPWLREQAKKNLAEGGQAHPVVQACWEGWAAGEVSKADEAKRTDA